MKKITLSVKKKHALSRTSADISTIYIEFRVIFCMILFYCNFFYRKIKTGPFIHDAIETRLRMIIPYIDKWPQVNYRHSIDKWWELESGVYTIIIYNIRKKHFSLIKAWCHFKVVYNLLLFMITLLISVLDKKEPNY